MKILAQIPGLSAAAIIPDPGQMDAKTIKYVIADACVLLVACGHCQAPIGKLCRGLGGRPTLSCHVTRRRMARHPKKALRASGALHGAWRVLVIEEQDRSRKRKSSKRRRV